MRHAYLLAFACVLALPLMAAADDRVALDGDDKPVQLTTTFGSRSGPKLAIRNGKPVALVKGEAAGTVVAGHGKVVVALATSARAPFWVAVVDGGKLGKPIAIARPGRRDDDLPFAVVGTATPTGFAVFFQEVELDDPTAAHTYLVELDDEGALHGEAREVPVPWALADAAHNGDGYHLALIYPGDGRGMRLSMVSLSAAGQPQQHPDWASAAGIISDVHLVVGDASIRAFYRGGKGGNRLLESDVTQIRQWGSEPPKAKDHGAIGGREAIAIARGKPTKVKLAR